MTLVSPAKKRKNARSDLEYILRRRSFIYTMNTRGPRIDPWGTP